MVTALRPREEQKPGMMSQAGLTTSSHLTRVSAQLSSHSREVTGPGLRARGSPIGHKQFCKTNLKRSAPLHSPKLMFHFSITQTGLG